MSRLVTFVTSGSLAAAASAAAQQPATPAAPAPVAQGALVLGEETSRRIAPPAAHRWTVELAAGEYAEVEVAQRGVDLVVRVLTPSGTLREEYDDMPGTSGNETVRLVADARAAWTLELAPARAGATT